MGSAAFAKRAGQDRPLDSGWLRQIAQLHVGVLVFYAIDSALLTAYGQIGIVPVRLGLLYLASGWTAAGLAVVAFRRGRRTVETLHVNTLVLTGCAAAQMLSTAFAVPAIGVPMLMSLMTVLAAAALQLTTRRLLVTWAACACATAAVVLASAGPLQFPMATSAQRMLSAVWFAWLLAKCAMINVEGTRLRALAAEANMRLGETLVDLEKVATTDELTVIPNRRAIVSGLNAALATAAGQLGSVAVALFDIDHFKRVNDRLGHPTGDAVLREFASIVATGLRPSDSVGRYGGEEFLLVLQDVKTAPAARETADRIRRSIEAFDWRRLGEALDITASAGVALIEPGEAAAGAIARADRALYRAKAEGRNRVMLG